MKKKKYKYLIAYGFNQKIPSGYEDHPYYNQGGTGRMILNLEQKIETEGDILSVESLLMSNLEDSLEHLDRVSLYSFNLLQ